MADVTLLVGSKSDVPVAKPALDALQLGLKLPLGGPLSLFGFLGRRIGR
mgnify:CR=1 FL=1